MDRLKLQFQSLNDAMHMGDHGIYVWLVYLVTSIVFVTFLIAVNYQLTKDQESE